jgi:serine/threonine protein phosphatase 1
VLISGYPGLPRSWRGDAVHVVRLDGPVAVIGDIRGRADLLRRLLPLLHGRALFVTGDVGDRGPETREVLDLLVERQATGVVGNHDVWLMTWAASEGFDPLALSPTMGGRATLASYGVTAEQAMAGVNAVPETHRDWLLGLHVAIDLEVVGRRFWLVHGGVPSDVDMAGMTTADVVPMLARQRPSDLMWRAIDPATMVPLDRPVIMGHMRVPRPLDLGHVIAIDTGAADPRDGRLTALLLPERTFVTVE